MTLLSCYLSSDSTSQQKYAIHLPMKDTLSITYINDFRLPAFICLRTQSDGDVCFQILLYYLVELTSTQPSLMQLINNLEMNAHTQPVEMGIHLDNDVCQRREAI